MMLFVVFGCSRGLCVVVTCRCNVVVCCLSLLLIAVSWRRGLLVADVVIVCRCCSNCWLLLSLLLDVCC